MKTPNGTMDIWGVLNHKMHFCSWLAQVVSAGWCGLSLCLSNLKVIHPDAFPLPYVSHVIFTSPENKSLQVFPKQTETFMYNSSVCLCSLLMVELTGTWLKCGIYKPSLRYGFRLENGSFFHTQS